MVMAVDLGFVFVLFLSILGGVRNGFVETLISLAAFMAGILAAFHLPRPLVRHLPEWAQAASWVEILLGIVLFLLAVLLVRLIGTVAGGDASRAHDSSSRSLGAILGFARGALLCAFLASVLVLFVPPDQSIIRGSRALHILAPTGRWVAAIAPPPLGDRIVEAWRERDRPGPRNVIETVSVCYD